MEKITTVTGVVAPVLRANIDTDQITPAKYLKEIRRTGYEDALFENWRTDEDFILNREGFQQATILLAGPDFGIGSSREHAVWALRDYGFRVVISTRFADIFRTNAGKNGLLTAQISDEAYEILQSIHDGTRPVEMTVDLVSKTITVGEHELPFMIDDHTRHCLLEGLDDIALTLQHDEQITAFEQQRPAFLPTTG